MQVSGPSNKGEAVGHPGREKTRQSPGHTYQALRSLPTSQSAITPLTLPDMKTLIATIVTAVLVAGCSQQVKETSAEFNKLPASVQKSVKSHAPNAEIAKVNETKRDG